MMELLEKAWAGWGNYITQGKLAALFLVILLFLWFYKKSTRKNALLIYAVCGAIGCIFPLTAAALMAYQTRFYDYEWIWSIVPLTGVLAYGLTVFLTEFWRTGKFGKKATGLAVTGICIVTLLLCGTMGEKKEDGYSAYMKVLYPYGSDVPDEMYRQQAYEAVESLREIVGDGEVMLWAPIEVMEYAREADAGIRLLYGRNMWDDSLDGYSYDVYDEVLYDLYLWIETADGSMDLWSEQLREDAAALPAAEECVRKAVGLGVNCVLLSRETDMELVELVAGIFGAKAQQIEEYWVIYE